MTETRLSDGSVLIGPCLRNEALVGISAPGEQVAAITGRQARNRGVRCAVTGMDGGERDGTAAATQRGPTVRQDSEPGRIRLALSRDSEPHVLEAKDTPRKEDEA